MAIINAFLDITTSQEDQVITPGQPAKIFGINLRVDTADDKQGVYFVRTDNGKETKVSVFVDNQPSKLAIIIPPGLSKGEYTLNVKTLLNQKYATAEHGLTLRVV